MLQLVKIIQNLDFINDDDYYIYKMQRIQTNQDFKLGNIGYPLIPKEAFLLFPSDKQIYTQTIKNHNEKPICKRLIYGNSINPKYTIEQQQKIDNFTQFLKEKKKLEVGGNEGQRTNLLKLVYANKNNFEDAYENYLLLEKWNSSFYPLSSISSQYRNKMQQLLKEGVIYVSPVRDQYMKPITIVHVGRLLSSKPQTQLFLDAFGYFLQSIIDKMMIDGQLQTWNVIVDVDQTAVFSFAGALYNLIKFVSKIFIGRMFRCYVLNHTFFITFVWGTVSMMMDKEQNDKTKILDYPQILSFIPKQSLQSRYGGIIQPIKDFWPLDSPERLQIARKAEPRLRQIWHKQNLLVSEKQYYIKYVKKQVGTKLCTSIIQKFQNQQFQQLKMKRVASQSRRKQFERLIEIENLDINSKVPKQLMPITLKITQKLNSNGLNRSQDSKKDTFGSINSVQAKSQEEIQSQSSQLSFDQIKSKIIKVKKQVFTQLNFNSIFKKVSFDSTQLD